MTPRNILNMAPADFANRMQAAGIEKGYVVHIDGKMICSDDLFTELSHEMAALPDYRRHEGVFIKHDAETECLFMVFVHSTVRGQAQGGTRLKHRDYEKIGGAIEDGLRLSKGMTDKNSISKLWWGGGKAIICPVSEASFARIDAHTRDNGKKVFTDTALRSRLFSNYGSYVASLNGAYIAAEDMNTTPEDMLTILSACRFVSCLPAAVGGSSNPSRWTAEGVFNALKATIRHYEGKNNLEGKTVAIQGVGSVGGPLAEFVLKSGGSLVIFDYDKEACRAIKEFDGGAYAGKVAIVETISELYTAECDVFSPCAIGGILSPDTIPLLKCRYVVGAANNQLKNFDADYRLLEARGIVYLPDFFINRLGIINCANEQYGRLEDDLRKEVDKIYGDPVNGTLSLLAECTKTGKTPQEVAIHWATEWGKIPHPIWGHRGIELIRTVIAK